MVLSADRPWGPQIPSMIAKGKLPANVPTDFGYVTDAAQKGNAELMAKKQVLGFKPPPRLERVAIGLLMRSFRA
jgi:hypothetical protein